MTDRVRTIRTALTAALFLIGPASADGRDGLPDDTTACVEGDGWRLCHSLALEDVSRTCVMETLFICRVGPPTAVFSGMRVCEGNGTAVVAETTVEAGGIPTELLADYPELAGEAERHDLKIKPDDPALRTIFQILGESRDPRSTAIDAITDFRTSRLGQYLTLSYVPVDNSINACRSYWSENDE